MNRIADYVYKIYGNQLFIKDLNLGKISLTNSLENVLAEISQKDNIKDLDIIQVDSEEDLDRVLWDGENVGWQPINEEEKKNLTIIINQLFN